ncbi:MAG: acetolactate decarboxylase [Candidatus Omnitrophota bacterium]|jgi:acetolactate decarboxylase
MKKNLSLLVFFFFLGCAHAPCKKDIVFQNAPINALLAGCYSGTMSVHDLEKHGDFGLGTLDALDGEMVVLDHSFYQVKPDGRAYLLSGKDTSPFATVTFFEAGQELFPEGAMGYKELTGFLDEKLPSKNLIYAIKVDGRFSLLRVRSAVRQKKPFPVLTEAIKAQKVFEWKNQEGTLVGFRYPPYMEGVNVPGYHFHFLSKNKTLGGHVLDLQVENPRIQIDKSHGFLMELPENEEFLKFRFEADAKDAIQRIEK